MEVASEKDMESGGEKFDGLIPILDWFQVISHDPVRDLFVRHCKKTKITINGSLGYWDRERKKEIEPDWLGNVHRILHTC